MTCGQTGTTAQDCLRIRTMLRGGRRALEIVYTGSARAKKMEALFMTCPRSARPSILPRTSICSVCHVHLTGKNAGLYCFATPVARYFSGRKCKDHFGHKYEGQTVLTISIQRGIPGAISPMGAISRMITVVQDAYNSKKQGCWLRLDLSI